MFDSTRIYKVKWQDINFRKKVWIVRNSHLPVKKKKKGQNWKIQSIPWQTKASILSCSAKTPRAYFWCSVEERSSNRFWNDLRVRKQWHKFHFCVNWLFLKVPVTLFCPYLKNRVEVEKLPRHCHDWSASLFLSMLACLTQIRRYSARVLPRSAHIHF